MTVDAGNDTDVDELILRVYHPAVRVELTTLRNILDSLATTYEACAWLTRDLAEQTAASVGLVLPGRSPALVVREIRSGSIWLDLVQNVAPEAGAGGALWLMARALRRGPGQLYEWAGLLPRAQAEWYRNRADAIEQRARLRAALEAEKEERSRIHAAHEALIQLAEDAPGMRVAVVDRNGIELQEPPNIRS